MVGGCRGLPGEVKIRACPPGRRLGTDVISGLGVPAEEQLGDPAAPLHDTKQNQAKRSYVKAPDTCALEGTQTSTLMK